jgi:DNA-binding response OmpR family regulator
VYRQGHILVVESDDSIRELLERWLREAGYTVVVGDYDNLARQDIPLLVIANVSSPRGAETLVRSLRVVYAAPILVVSARFRRGLGESTDVALRLGVTKVLPKPFTREELLCAVRESIKGTR